MGRRQIPGNETFCVIFGSMGQKAELERDCEVIVTNKTDSNKAIVQFHNGRGSQEAIFGDTKGDCGLNVIATRKLAGNQIYTLCAMMAHNLSKESRGLPP